MAICSVAELGEPALALARKLAEGEDRTGRWVGKDALRELREKALPPNPLPKGRGD